jgi:hypothetical protein
VQKSGKLIGGQQVTTFYACHAFPEIENQQSNNCTLLTAQMASPNKCIISQDTTIPWSTYWNSNNSSIMNNMHDHHEQREDKNVAEDPPVPEILADMEQATAKNDDDTELDLVEIALQIEEQRDVHTDRILEEARQLAEQRELDRAEDADMDKKLAAKKKAPPPKKAPAKATKKRKDVGDMLPSMVNGKSILFVHVPSTKALCKLLKSQILMSFNVPAAPNSWCQKNKL